MVSLFVEVEHRFLRLQISWYSGIPEGEAGRLAPEFDVGMGHLDDVALENSRGVLLR